MKGKPGGKVVSRGKAIAAAKKNGIVIDKKFFGKLDRPKGKGR
jgi:hypothetical protein